MKNPHRFLFYKARVLKQKAHLQSKTELIELQKKYIDYLESINDKPEHHKVNLPILPKYRLN